MKAGVYHESIILKKPILLQGEKGTTLQICSSKPAIKITGKKVSINNIRVIGCKKDSSSSVIYISGKDHYIENVKIDAATIGIALEAAENTTVRNSNISGNNSQKGLDIWESSYFSSKYFSRSPIL